MVSSSWDAVYRQVRCDFLNPEMAYVDEERRCTLAGRMLAVVNGVGSREWLCSVSGGQGSSAQAQPWLACFDRGAWEETSRVWVNGPSWTSGFFDAGTEARPELSTSKLAAGTAHCRLYYKNAV